MHISYDHATQEVVVRLTDLEAQRLTAVICRDTGGTPDPDYDYHVQLWDALTELYS